MIVYDDTVGLENLREKQQAVIHLLRESAAAPVAIERHQMLVAALIEAGELTQALADVRFAARRGVDAGETVEATLMAALVALAAAVGRSWDSGFAPIPVGSLVQALDRLPVPDQTATVRHPEGFAHYALYPEAYWSAARRFAPCPDATVIGLRSIGTTLGATVAAAFGALGAVTVRPVGHPFRRTLCLAPALQAAWAARPAGRYAIVDEGPGLSGSSFGAVADALERLGVAPAALTFFPGHAGDLGPEADPAHRLRWARSPKPCRSFAELTGPTAQPHQRPEAWVADLTGVPTAPPEDCSGGGWRTHLVPDVRLWPPVDRQNEKLKLRVLSVRGWFLLRFVGNGRRGRAKLEIARRLAAAGFGVGPLGWRHGFLVERWLGGARPLRADDPADRQAVVSRLPAYLAFRATHLPAATLGATPAELLAMARANGAEALGEAAVAGLDRWTAEALARLAKVARPALVDGRLHPWEWLACPDASVVKTDALDHHAAHDLIGAQDIGWDIAGAGVEWSLSPGETVALAGLVAQRTGAPLDRDLLRLYAVAYPAFQLGAYTMAAARAGDDEKPRLLDRAMLYRTALIAALAASSTKL